MQKLVTRFFIVGNVGTVSSSHVRPRPHPESHSGARDICMGNRFNSIIREAPQRPRARCHTGAAFRDAFPNYARRIERPVPRRPWILGNALVAPARVTPLRDFLLTLFQTLEQTALALPIQRALASNQPRALDAKTRPRL